MAKKATAKRSNAKTIPPKKTVEERKDKRRAVTLYLDPEITKRLKRVALDRDTNAYELAEIAIEAWLNIEEKKQ